MFPSGRAGLSLLMLRVSVALAPLLVANLMGGDLAWRPILRCVAAVMLLLGYLTPVVSLVSLLLALTTVGEPSGFTTSQAAVFILDAGALMLIGPGAYSLDGRSFGRRLVRIPKP